MNAHEAVQQARTLLFVPGSRPDRFTRASESGADLTILDLEDAVALPDKPSALTAILARLDGLDATGAGVATTMVRINATGTPWHSDEVDALAARGVALMVPKAEDVSELRALHQHTGGLPLVPLIETPQGILRSADIAGAPGVVRLALGHIDLAATLGLDPDAREAFVHARSHLVLASAAAGLPAPVDGVTLATTDRERLTDDLRHAVRLGFGAKLCIHPRQVDVVHEVLRPSPDEIDWARRVVEVAQEGGVQVVDGQMVDRPVLLRAQGLLARAGS